MIHTLHSNTIDSNNLFQFEYYQALGKNTFLNQTFIKLVGGDRTNLNHLLLPTILTKYQ
jgi:hypothetical protein